jgi:transposase
MRTRTYLTVLMDQQWRLVKHLIPVYPGGRPRRTPTRDLLGAVVYVL